MPEANPAIAGIDARIEQLSQQQLKIQAQIKQLQAFRMQIMDDMGVQLEISVENLCLGQDFSRMQPIEAIVIVLREAGRPLKLPDLLTVLERCNFKTQATSKTSMPKRLGNLRAAIAMDRLSRIEYTPETNSARLKKPK